MYVLLEDVQAAIVSGWLQSLLVVQAEPRATRPAGDDDFLVFDFLALLQLGRRRLVVAVGRRAGLISLLKDMHVSEGRGRAGDLGPRAPLRKFFDVPNGRR